MDLGASVREERGYGEGRGYVLIYCQIHYIQLVVEEQVRDLVLVE